MWPLAVQGHTDSTPPKWKPQLKVGSCIEIESDFQIVLHECKYSLDGTLHRCPLQEETLNGSAAATACESDQCKCTWKDCEHTYCCCCSTEMNPNICRKHDKPMAECGCKLKDTKVSTEPDTGVCCYCTYHGWTQCEEGCKQRHPYGSGRWQHVLELNAQVTFRNCSDEAQYLAAFKRHRVEQQQRVRRQRDENKENRDSDDALPDRTTDSANSVHSKTGCMSYVARQTLIRRPLTATGGAEIGPPPLCGP